MEKHKEEKIKKAESLYSSSRAQENGENKFRNFTKSVSTFVHKIFVLKIGTFVKYCYLKQMDPSKLMAILRMLPFLLINIVVLVMFIVAYSLNGTDRCFYKDPNRVFSIIYVTLGVKIIFGIIWPLLRIALILIRYLLPHDVTAMEVLGGMIDISWSIYIIGHYTQVYRICYYTAAWQFNAITIALVNACILLLFYVCFIVFTFITIQMLGLEHLTFHEIYEKVSKRDKKKRRGCCCYKTKERVENSHDVLSDSFEMNDKKINHVMIGGMNTDEGLMEENKESTVRTILKGGSVTLPNRKELKQAIHTLEYANEGDDMDAADRLQIAKNAIDKLKEFKGRNEMLHMISEGNEDEDDKAAQEVLKKIIVELGNEM